MDAVNKFQCLICNEECDSKFIRRRKLANKMRNRYCKRGYTLFKALTDMQWNQVQPNYNTIGKQCTLMFYI